VAKEGALTSPPPSLPAIHPSLSPPFFPSTLPLFPLPSLPPPATPHSWDTGEGATLLACGLSSGEVVIFEVSFIVQDFGFGICERRVSIELSSTFDSCEGVIEELCRC